MIFLEYAVDVAQACRERGIKTRGGHGGLHRSPSRAREFFAHMDAANVDLKGFTEGFYQRALRAATSSPCSRRSST